MIQKRYFEKRKHLELWVLAILFRKKLTKKVKFLAQNYFAL